MKMVPFHEFDTLYRSKVLEVLAYWTPEMQEEMSLHCHPWGVGRFDFHEYLNASSVRFYKAYCSLSDMGNVESICDIGGFWGGVPLTLSSLGYRVTMTESLTYYGKSFEALFRHIAAKGVHVVNYDPFEKNSVPPGKFTMVYVMAMLEHYPHSLKHFMANVLSMIDPRGCLYIEVPNIAYWAKRMALMRGMTPLVPAMDIYRSEIPFTGHHHEFSKHEMRELASEIGLTILREDFYTYSVGDSWIHRFRKYPFGTLAQWLFPDTRECISYLMKR